MIFAGKHRLPPKNTIDLGHSAWVNIEPNESIGLNQRQREIAFVKKLLIRLIKCLNGKPPIYVITPFREMKDELKRQIKLLPDWNRIGIKGKDWVDENVGTVHTFQGKENQIVLLVLGCDEKNIRSASALVSKPNLINVAATRAKHRFFIVGNRRVWTKHYALFDETFSLLGKQEISGEAMLEQAERIIFRKQN